jgi:hypothetical protein
MAKAKKAKQHGAPMKRSDADKTAGLRALRLAHEASSRSAGTWGEMTVGEIVHEISRSVFVQVWKGPRRPDPFEDGAARRDAPRGLDWTAMVSWVNARRSTEFSRRVVAWDVNAIEARKIAEARIAEHRAAGYTVINPADAP